MVAILETKEADRICGEFSMSKNRIKQNFYATSIRKFERIPQDTWDAMTDEQKEWYRIGYWYNEYELPDGRLYAGWSTQHPTKLTKDDLPEDYIFISGYKKRGYMRTAGVKGLVYKRSPFHNHTFKDDFLYISYTKPLGEYVDGYDKGSTYAECDEYIFGNDIVDFIVAVDKWSPEIDTSRIKEEMVEQYNAYCDEMSCWPHYQCKKIEKFEDLL